MDAGKTFDDLDMYDLIKRDKQILKNLFLTYVDLLFEIIFGKLVTDNCIGCQTKGELFPQFHNLCNIQPKHIIEQCLDEAFSFLTHEEIDKYHFGLCRDTIFPNVNYFEGLKWQCRATRDMTFKNEDYKEDIIEAINEKYENERFFISELTNPDAMDVMFANMDY